MSYLPYHITMALSLIFLNHDAFAINGDYIKKALNICNTDFIDFQINKHIRLTTYSEVEGGSIKTYESHERNSASNGGYVLSYSSSFNTALRNIVAIRYVTEQIREDYESYYVGAVCKESGCIYVNNKEKRSSTQFTQVAECNTLEKARKTAEMLATALDVNLARENHF